MPIIRITGIFRFFDLFGFLHKVMPDLEQSINSILDPTIEFDPVSEIKTLRQSLTQRLQNLQLSDATEKSETNFQFQYDLEAVSSASIETIEPEMNDLPDSPTLILAQQISHARELLSQLQIDKPLSKKSVKSKKTPKTDSNREKIETSLPSLETLQTMNMVLTCFGFFSLLTGTFLSFRYMDSEIHFALPVIVAGVTVIAVGCLGRLVFLQPQV